MIWHVMQITKIHFATSGSFAIFAAIRRASPLVSSLAVDS
jgi:hypothetical protein